MSDDTHFWSGGWSVGLRVWIERKGQSVLGEGRLELLEAIDRCHSISGAAREIGMSYRKAWLLVQEVNTAAGEALVVAATGGTHGGGAHLTPRAKRVILVFRELHQHLIQTAAGLLPRLVHSPESPAVHVLAAVSLEEVLGQLLTDFTLRRPDIRVRAIFGASDELGDHLLAGSPGNLFLTADPSQIDRLEAAGLVKSEPHVTFAENTLAAVAPSDRELHVHRPNDLAEIGEARVALADPASPLGRYTRVFLEGLGVYETLLARATLVDNSRAVVAAIRAGRADLGIVYGSDAAHVEGCQLLFRVRRPPQAIQYGGVVLQGRPHATEAQVLLNFLVSGPAATRFRRCGFLPVSS